MLPGLHTNFSRDRSGGLVFPSLSEFSTVYCDPHKGFVIVNKAEIDVKRKILRRGDKNTPKNCTKKDLHDQDNHDSVITHLEPDILECEVKWALGSITTNKASGGDGIPVELFQILKDDAVNVLHSICQQIWKTQQWPQGLKMSIFIPIPKKGNAKECSNYCTIALISHDSKVSSKFSKPGFSNM